MASNLKVAGIAAAGTLTMLGVAFASDPLYDAFCRVTGFGGTTQVATSAPSEIVERTVEVRFDANVADTPLTFRPLQATQTVNLNQHGLAFYEVTNPSDQPVTVIASYNVTPHMAGPYFNKLECFCFEERVIAPGETKKLPVVYFVNADMLDGGSVSSTRTITLSYTFFDSSDFSDQPPAVRAGAAKTARAG